MTATEQHFAPGEHSHPGPVQYVRIALILAVVTAGEIGIYYLGGLSKAIVVVMLLTFMVLKFALVALWFMHLRFDSRIFRRLFVTGIVLAMSIYTVVLVSLSR